MESALYSIYTLDVFVSENSCVNTIRAHFSSGNLYILYGEDINDVFSPFFMVI